ncbi:hypothetical protein HHI36_020898 [Cryptolaemus montrouzieri]|uniref:PH domain-containing protein n=1 Tax=Cryptolaemus montrouzieri TaxID=559131 RepID=A0ABD2NBM8_9CUCU
MSGVSSNGPVCETVDNGGRALKLQTDAPHLVSMGGDRLSTSVTLHPIPQGRVILGTGPGVDIPVQGTGVSAIHCHIENSEGVVTIYPLADYLSIDGVKVTVPTRLYQGAMLTIGRSNYMRFNHPAEAKLMKSVLPNPRISMPPISFEQETVKFLKKPPAVPKKSPRESFSDSGGDEPPSTFMTKLSKFEYLAAQNLKKSISPKVFASNAVTVNTPARDVLGKSPPDLHNLAKNLPQSALNYSDLNHNEKQKVKGGDRPLFGKKSPQYVNVSLNDAKNINNRVVIYENGIKQQNINLDENELLSKTSSGSKNINVHRVITPSPGYNRNPGPYNRSVTPSPVTKNVNAIHRRSGSLDQLTNGSIYDNSEDLNERKKEAEIKRNQAQQDRIKEQELEKAEQARLEEILNMCAEYEKQSQNEKNKPVTPNRIKTNGSLPRDKRQQISQSPFGTSPYSTPPSSPGVFDFSKTSPPSYENTPPNFPLPRNKITSNYENIDFTPPEVTNDRRNEINSYENVQLQSTPTGHYPNSPRTRIKTFLTASKDSSPKDASNIVENKFAILEKEQYLLENLNTTRDSTDNSIDGTTRKPTPTKFILPLEDVDLIHESYDKPANNCNVLNGFVNRTNSVEFKTNRARYESLKKEKRRLLDVVGNLKTLMSEIEIQEEELHIEMDMERALLSGEHKSKLLDLENLQAKKEKLAKQAQKIEKIMQEAQHKQTENEKACQEKLKAAQENMADIEKKLASTEKATEEYEAVFEQFLKSQEVLDGERKAFEDLEFHHLEEEANWLATREELQREVVDLSHRIENLRSHIGELEQQSLDAANANNKEYKSLESQKINCLVRLEEIRNRLKDIDGELAEFSDQESEHEMSSDTDSDKSRNGVFTYDSKALKDLSCSIIVSNSTLPAEPGYNMSHSFNDKLMQDRMMLEPGIEKRFPSQDDIDRISKVTSDSPIDIGSLNRKTIESLKEIERNRHLHLCQQGSQVIEHERQRVQALKERAQQEVRNKWAQRIQDCASITSTGSEETASGEKTDDSNAERSEVQEPSSSPDQFDSRNDNDDITIQQRPLSEVSEMSLEGGTFKKRCKPATDKQRPLTRYLPIRGSDLDLRQHIESAGHQVVLCPHVLINATSCRGFLHKKGSKLNGWSRRWFVFDRSKHTFSYYADKSEKKARGGAYFQAIEEVYLDHSKSVKSPNPQLTFIVKTHERYYYLMAPSPEAMRIWVDVIFTGAEGYQEFEYGT